MQVALGTEHIPVVQELVFKGKEKLFWKLEISLAGAPDEGV